MLGVDQLRHLSPETAGRHVFFFSTDLQWCCHWLQSPRNPRGITRDLLGTGYSEKWSNNATARVILVHLGDDDVANQSHSVRNLHWSPRPIWGSSAGPEPLRVTNGLVVPYRVSHWVDDHAWRTWQPERPRRYLLYSNVAVGRARERGGLLRAINHSAHGRSIHLRKPIFLATMVPHQEMASPAKALRLSLDADFCLCPTGDAKGFTARFYFSLLLGCLPVRVDGWRRNQDQMPTTWPNAHLVDWSRVVIDVPFMQAVSPTHGLLQKLLAIPGAEVVARRSHLRSVAHWLAYDELAEQTSTGLPDAADAAVAQLIARVRGAS